MLLTRTEQPSAPGHAPGEHIHLVGIGGSGLSAIARVLLGRGYVVSGSDRQPNEQTAALAALGATIFAGHAAGHIAGASHLLRSSAVPDDNPEVVAARAAGVPVLKRSDFLGQLMADRHGIAVAGTHGKTTTTGLIAHVLIAAGLDPTVIVGGVLPTLGANGRAGDGPHFVVEADEYDHMFLGLRPRTAVVTNVEHDHPDIFPSEGDYMEAFRRFVALLPADGRLVLGSDDPGARLLLSTLENDPAHVDTFGLNGPGAARSVHYRALDLRPNNLGGVDFLVQARGDLLGLVRLRLPGAHNVRNALAAIAVALGAGVAFADVQQALISFGGIGRRFQVTGEVGRVTVIDDYAHHPTEIQATLAAARQRYPGRRLWAVWQPHTFSRTKLLLAAFARSFGDADRVVALDIYRSRETDTLGIGTATVVAVMDHPDVHYVADRRAAADFILDRVRPDDVILTLGAGDGDAVGVWVLEGLEARLAGRA